MALNGMYTNELSVAVNAKGEKTNKTNNVNRRYT